MAVVLVQSGAADEALKKLDEAIRLNPDYGEAVLLRAELKVRTGAANDAIASLVPFTKRHPEHVPASLVLANAYAATDRSDQALTIYRTLIQSAPSVPEFRIFAGMILRQQNNLEEARSYFEQALKMAPASSLAAEQ